MSIAVTTRIDRDHSAAIHHQNPNPRSAVRLSSFRIAFAPAREVKRSEIRKGCDWKNGLFPSRNCIAAAAQSAGWHLAHRSLLPAPLHLRSYNGAAASLRRRPDSSQQQMRHRCPTMRSGSLHHRMSQRVSQDPDIPAIQCGILLSSSQRTMIRRRLYAHEKRVTIF
jgi:hypothetical protein